MIQATSTFKTRARTIDHLGREQIADCPTAISELWKNAYDAYAKNVALHIFDGDYPVAALVDNGHGMTTDDLNNKWLTVGTESKATLAETPEADRNGLPPRVKQGQKGIGRLSCAALGSLLLLVSKKKGEPFVASMLDWRLFENPFLMLEDVKIPVSEFETREELVALLPDMFDSLMGNLWGDGEDAARDHRVEQAWQYFEEQEIEAADRSQTQEILSTKKKIEQTVVEAFFSERHFENWEVWSGKSSHGTAMFMVDIHDDVLAQLSSDAGSEVDGAEQRANERFFQTLNNFINPFCSNQEEQITDFKTSVVAWNGNLQRFIIDEVRDFNLQQFEQLEHMIDGYVDETGLFSGRIRAFGEWHEDVIIRPKAGYKMRKDTRFGALKIHLGTFEVERKNSSLSDEQWRNFDVARTRFGGAMVHRDNLRVMPYGREDNDFFEMEKRRSKNAGLYVFSNRACFGGVQITKEGNPNLRDKAGREGLIDNKASKLFREVVENILVEVAKRFIGRASENRKEKLAEINAHHDAIKQEKDRKTFLRKEQKRVKGAIKKSFPQLQNKFSEIQEIVAEFSGTDLAKDQDELNRVRHLLNQLDGELKLFSLSPVPRSLGSAEEAYREYRDIEIAAKNELRNLNASVNSAIEKLVERNDVEIAEKDFRSKAAVLHGKINKLAKEGRKLLEQELARFNEKIAQANKSYFQKISPYLDDIAAKRTTLAAVMETIEHEYQLEDIEINQLLTPYIKALQSLGEQIDLEGLAVNTLNENSQLRKRIEQINSLAQLGISVEIIGHEIEGSDMTIERGLKSLKETELTIAQQAHVERVVEAHQSLSDSWRFLSPLKLSGEKIRTDITGKDIYQYVNQFFGERFANNQIEFVQTPAFSAISLYEQPAKLYPVFINLVNNARYWVKQSDHESRVIQLDVKEGIVYVSDNGPGVDIDDIDQLFTIFFTKKQRGGRGVGLYLCKQNLSSGGHKIFYETREDKQLLSGANFAIEFKGLNHAS